MRCERCGRELPGNAESSCPDCGDTRTATVDSGSRTAAPGSAPSAGPTIEPGTVFASRYRILEFAGRGAMGEVYRAEDLKLGQVVALKFLRDEAGGDSRYLARLLNEVKTARQVAHPNVCRVYDVGEAEGRHFLSMEWIDGETLAAMLTRRGRPPLDEAVRIARRLCAGLAAAHDRGVIHRDLTPSNVMLDESGAVRITDFGVAELGRVVRGRRAREGTPAYMAPEQFAGEEVTARSDIYSLGLLLYELFTGQQAYRGTSTVRTAVAPDREPPPPPSRLAPDVDPAIEAAILGCLASDPAQRPASARQVGEVLPGDDGLFEVAAAAQQRADRIAAFRAELSDLRQAGVMKVAEADLAAVERYHESVLGDLVRRFDVDVSLRGRQLSLGMRIASLLGAIAFSFAAWFFFQRIWGYLAVPVQVGLLASGPAVAVLGTAYASRREKSLYFTMILAVVAFALFAIDLSVLGITFSLPESYGAWLALGLFAFALAYAHGLHSLLVLAIACAGVGLGGLIAELAGVWWARFAMRPESVLPVAVLCALAPRVAGRHGPASFAPVYRLFALAWFAYAVFFLGNLGMFSFLPLEKQTVEILYQLAGFLVASAAVWLGLRARWPETTYAASVFLVALLLNKFTDWWWNLLPKYAFFLIVGTVAIGFLVVLRTLRARLQRAAP